MSYFKEIKIIDDYGNLVSIREGTVSKLHVQDNNAEQLLSGILKELKKTNLHLSLLTDVLIKDSEID